MHFIGLTQSSRSESDLKNSILKSFSFVRLEFVLVMVVYNSVLLRCFPVQVFFFTEKPPYPGGSLVTRALRKSVVFRKSSAIRRLPFSNGTHKPQFLGHARD